MFVIRYLMVAVGLLGAVVAWGIGAQHSFWQIMGIAVAATFALQMMVLVYVAWAAARTEESRSSRPDPRPHLVVLPR